MGEKIINIHKVLKKIKQYINEYDSIYVLSDKDSIYVPFLRNSPLFVDKKYLLLVTGPERECISECGTDIRLISDEEYYMIKKLYYLYEFSDRIHFLDDREQCGGLDNYIMNDLLTEDEAAIALLK